MSKFKVGDILVDEEGDEVKVLGVCGELYFVSENNDFDYFFAPYTIKELRGLGLRLKDSEDDEKMNSTNVQATLLKDYDGLFLYINNVKYNILEVKEALALLNIVKSASKKIVE